jgi:DNA polymerase-4
MNSYFASVEQAHRPQLRGKPVLVAADPFGNPKGRRSVVAAASYEAKKFGISSGIPLFEALKLCPQAIIVGGNAEKYSYLSHRLYDLLHSYTDLVEVYSIDEAFLDITHTHHLFKGAENLAFQLKERVKKELGITCSVGVAPNKLVAKMASEWQKPDGLSLVKEEDLPEILWERPVEEIIGVGPKRKLKLARMGIKTIGDLASTSPSNLRQVFGIVGEYLYNAAWGKDDQPVTPFPPSPKSLSHSLTVEKNLQTSEEKEALLLYLTDELAFRLRKEGLKAGKIAVGLRFLDLSFKFKEVSVFPPTSSTHRLFAYALKGLRKLPLRLPIRLMAVSFSSLQEGKEEQLSLFANECRELEKERAKDKIVQKFGSEAIFYASFLKIKPHIFKEPPATGLN